MKRFLERLGIRRGQTTAEYAIIVALIAIASISVILIFGNQLRAIFAAEAHQLSGDQQATPEDRDTQADSHIDKDMENW